MAVYFVESLKVQTRFIQKAMRSVAWQLMLILMASALGLAQAMANTSATTAPNPKANPADPDKVLRLALV